MPSGAAHGNQVPAHPADEIDDLLDARAAAIRDGDRAAWLAELDPQTTAATKRFLAAQGRVFDRVRSLRPASWSYQVAGGSALPSKRRSALGGHGNRVHVGIASRWYERCRNHPVNPRNLRPFTTATPLYRPSEHTPPMFA